MQKRILLRLLAGLVVAVGNGDTVQRNVWLSVLAVLRPAESAARRLIAIAAHGLAVVPIARMAGVRMPAFSLFDPRRRVDLKVSKAPGFGPNIRFLDGEDLAPPAKEDVPIGETVSTRQLQRRLKALINALEDIPTQAQRLVRVYQRLDRPIRPIRPGRPPGYRENGTHEIDEVLKDCHELALIRLAEPVRV